MELQRRLRVIYSWKIFNITLKNFTIYPIDLRPLKSITLSNLECVNNVTDHMLVGCSTFFSRNSKWLRILCENRDPGKFISPKKCQNATHLRIIFYRRILRNATAGNFFGLYLHLVAKFRECHRRPAWCSTFIRYLDKAAVRRHIKTGIDEYAQHIVISLA